MKKVFGVEFPSLSTASGKRRFSARRMSLSGLFSVPAALCHVAETLKTVTARTHSRAGGRAVSCGCSGRGQRKNAAALEGECGDGERGVTSPIYG